MANYRKRVKALERHLFGSPAMLARQLETARKLTVRWWIVDGVLGGVHGEAAHLRPADGEAAWLLFLAWCQEASAAGEPRMELTQDEFYRVFADMRRTGMIHEWELDPT